MENCRWLFSRMATGIGNLPPKLWGRDKIFLYSIQRTTHLPFDDTLFITSYDNPIPQTPRIYSSRELLKQNHLSRAVYGTELGSSKGLKLASVRALHPYQDQDAHVRVDHPVLLMDQTTAARSSNFFLLSSTFIIFALIAPPSESQLRSRVTL